MESMPGPPRTNIPVVIVGAIIVVTAVLGIGYDAMSGIAALMGAFEPMLQAQGIPYFYHAFAAMSGICVVFYGVLLVCGIDLARSRLRSTMLVTLVFVLEMASFLAIGPLWLHPTVGPSIGAATGVATGGMMIQFLILLPIWAPFVLWWAKWHAVRGQSDS